MELLYLQSSRQTSRYRPIRTQVDRRECDLWEFVAMLKLGVCQTFIASSIFLIYVKRHLGGDIDKKMMGIYGT